MCVTEMSHCRKISISFAQKNLKRSIPEKSKNISVVYNILQPSII